MALVAGSGESLAEKGAYDSSIMPNQQPIIKSENGERSFACSPAAVVVFVLNDLEEFLFGFHSRRQRWEVVSGALEAEETLLEGAQRELAEEMGPEIQVRSLGVIHADTFRYDDNAQYMISVSFLMAYEGGRILPGDDMAGSDFRWIGLDDILTGGVKIGIPRETWILQRAVEMYRLLR